MFNPSNSKLLSCCGIKPSDMSRSLTSTYKAKLIVIYQSCCEVLNLLRKYFSFWPESCASGSAGQERLKCECRRFLPRTPESLKLTLSLFKQKRALSIVSSFPVQRSGDVRHAAVSRATLVESATPLL